MTVRYGLMAAAAFAVGLAMTMPGAPARAADGGSPARPASCGAGMTWDPVSKVCIKAKNACKRGTVRDRKTGKCVEVKAFNGDSEMRYQVARFYAYDGRYEDAIALLDPIAYERDPRVLNMLGYSNRKLGHFDTGLAYYRRALAIDPSFDLAREYLGEGYVAIGRIDLAQEQLGHIARSCGIACEEYRALDKVINGALAAKG